MVVEKGTIAVQLVKEVLLEMRRQGLVVAPLLQQVDLEELLSKPYARVGGQEGARYRLTLYQCLIRPRNNPCCVDFSALHEKVLEPNAP